MATCCGTISRMNKRIDVLTMMSVSNSIGGRTQTWAVNTSVWASITPKTMNVQNDAGALEFATFMEILIRYSASIFALNKQEMRIRYGTRYMFVKSIVSVDEKNEYLKLTCVESVKADVTV